MLNDQLGPVEPSCSLRLPPLFEVSPGTALLLTGGGGPLHVTAPTAGLQRFSSPVRHLIRPPKVIPPNL